MEYSYIDSNIEWIGKIPNHWKRDKLFRLSNKIGSGGTPKSSNQSYYNGDIPWIQSGDLTDSWVKKTQKSITPEGLANSSAKVFEKGTLIIALYGATIGKLGIMDIKAAVNQACCAIEPSNKLDTKFLYYLLYDMRMFLLTQAYGGGQTNISQEIIKQHHIFVPTLKEQKAIAAYLDQACARIDRIIEIKERQLEKISLSLQKKLNEVILDGLGGFKKRKTRHEYIGEVPNHYRIQKLKHITKFINDGAHHTPNYLDKKYDDSIPFLRVTDLHKKNINLLQTKYISLEEHCELIKRCHPQKGDLLLSKNGTIGVTKVVDWDFNFSVFVSIAVIKPDPRLIDVSYLHYFFKSEIMKYQIAQGSKQITVTNLHLEKIRDFLIVLPPLDEQKELVKRMKSVEKLMKGTMSVIKSQIINLKNYRKSLIHECVTGKKQVYKPKEQQMQQA